MINQVKTPKEKIIVLINFCYILSTMVIDQPKTNRKNIAGADEVFPLVVYAIVKGNIRKLKSNLSFIEHFRHSTRLESTEEYYFKQTNAAVEFIENLNFASLNINEAEFNELIKSSELAEAERNKQTFNAIPKSKIRPY